MAARGGLKRNVASNFGGYVISILIAFVVTPVTIRSLGNQRYGVWALVAQLTGYYGLLDLGIRGAITHYTARYLAQGDREGREASLASGFWLLAALGAAALLVGAAIAILFPYVFKTGGVPVAEIRIAMLIMSAVIALNLPMATLSGALVGYERLDWVHGIEVLTRVLGAVATYLAMVNGYGLIALATIQAGIAFGRWMFTIPVLHRISGGLRLFPSLVRRASKKELASYAGRSMTINLALIVINRTDLVVIGVFLGTSWVTIYTVGQMLVEYLSAAASAVTFSFTPRLTHLAAGDDPAEVKRVYLLGARTAASLVAPIAGGMLAFGSAFLGLWLGREYVTGSLWKRSDVIMVLLLAARLPGIVQSISWQLIFATRQHGWLARLTVGEAICNLGLSLVLVQYFGIVGVALGTLIPLVATHIFLMPRFIAREYGIPFREFVFQGVGRPLVVGGVMALLGFLLTVVVPPATWLLFAVEAALTGGCGAVLLYSFVFTREERGQILQALSRLRGRLWKGGSGS